MRVSCFCHGLQSLSWHGLSRCLFLKKNHSLQPSLRLRLGRRFGLECCTLADMIEHVCPLLGGSGEEVAWQSLVRGGEEVRERLGRA